MTFGIQIYGLQSKIGNTVSVNIAGLDCGTYTVATDGSITVPYGSDPDNNFSAFYLVNVSNHAPSQGWGSTATHLAVYYGGSLTNVTVPVSIGYPYISQGQCVRPNSADMAKAVQGSSLGVTRRAYKFAAQVVAGVNDDLAFGTSFDSLNPVNFRDDDGISPLNHATVFTGVYVDDLDDQDSFDGMLCWQTSAPQPLTLAGVSTFLETEER